MFKVFFQKKTFFVFLAILLSGCASSQPPVTSPVSNQLVAKVFSANNQLAVTAFEKICVDNAFSNENMIKAAKAYSVGKATIKNSNSSKYGPRIETSMTTSDGMMEFVIIAPNKACQVRVNTGKSLIMASLFGTSYDDDAKALDIRLGMMLVKKFKDDITISREVKENKSNAQRVLILYGPTYARYENGKLLRYSLSAIGSENILSLNYES